MPHTSNESNEIINICIHVKKYKNYQIRDIHKGICPKRFLKERNSSTR